LPTAKSWGPALPPENRRNRRTASLIGVPIVRKRSAPHSTCSAERPTRQVARRMDHQNSSACRGCSNGHNLAPSPGGAHDAPKGRELLRDRGPMPDRLPQPMDRAYEGMRPSNWCSTWAWPRQAIVHSCVLLFRDLHLLSPYRRLDGISVKTPYSSCVA